MSTAYATPMPSVATSTTSTPSQLVPIGDILESKTNPRKTFDPAFIAELKASMQKHGFFGAILVRPHPVKTSAFELVAGAQRLRAAKEAGLPHVPAEIRGLTDDEVLEIQIVENLTRRDLLPLEEAEGYNTLLTKKYTLERIATRVGRSVEFVRDRCRLLKLINPAADFLREGRIELGHAIELAKLSPENQARAIRFEGGGLWDRQSILPTTSEEVSDPERGGDRVARGVSVRGNAFKHVTVGELKGWIVRHCRLDVKAPENAVLFPLVAAAVTAVAPTLNGRPVRKVIHITWDHMATDDVRKEKGERIYSCRSWTRADGKCGSKACASSITGVVVAGDRDYGLAFDVCVAKKTCQVHYKAEINAAAKRDKVVAKSGKTGVDRYALENKKREEERARENALRAKFEAALPQVMASLVSAVKAMPFKATGPLAEILIASVPKPYTPAAKTALGLLARGKSADDLIRFVVWGLIVQEASEWDAFRRFPALAKKFGFDASRIV